MTDERAGDAAAAAFGFQALVNTATWRVATGAGTAAEADYLANFAGRWPLVAVPLLWAGWLAWESGRLLRARRPALLVVLSLVLAAVLALSGTRRPRVLAARGLWLILGMIAVDLASDLPYLLAGRAIEPSVLNNTLHNGTLVHVLWLPLALTAIGVGLVGVLRRDRDRRALAMLPMLAAGAGLLFGVVDPAEARLAACGPDLACAAAWVPRIGWSHATSAVLLLVAVVLIRPRAVASGG